jgi:hypothetical protein
VAVEKRLALSPMKSSRKQERFNDIHIFSFQIVNMDTCPHFRRLAVVGLVLLMPRLCLADGSLARGSDGSVGLSFSYRGQPDADYAALNSCGGECQIVQRFRHACVAVSKARRGGFAFAISSHEGAAQTAAVKECDQQIEGCGLAASGCDE